ncbi:MAG: T9SS type A sorting domain-containing protein [Ignavibacteria bacterium]
MKKLLLIITLCLAINISFARTEVSDYQSKQSGNWTNASTWQYFDGTNWVDAVSPPTLASNNITIRNLHTISLSGKVSADQIIVEQGGTIVINSSDSLIIENGTGTDADISGSVINGGTIIQQTGSAMIFNDGGKYQHNRNGGTVPTAVWNNNSLCRITGITTTFTYTSLNQIFGSFNWNCPNQSAIINLSGSLKKVNGDFSIDSSGTAALQLSSYGYDTLRISGNIFIRGGKLDLGTSTARSTLLLNGNFSVTGGTVDNPTTTSSYLAKVVFNNSGPQNYYWSGGNIILTKTGWLVASGSTLNLSSDFRVGRSSSSIKNSLMVFGTLDCGDYTVRGDGDFTVSTDGTLVIRNQDGIWKGLTAKGCVQVTGTRNFYTTANFVYCGNADQNTGDGLMTVGNVAYVNDITIDNQSGGALIPYYSLQVMRNFILKKGYLNLNGKTFGYTATGKLIYNSTAPLTTTDTEFPSTGGPFDLIINNPGVTLHTDRTINGTVSLLSGGLNLNGNILTLGSAGTLSETLGNVVYGTGQITTTRSLLIPQANNVGGLGVIITSSANLGNTVVSRGHQAYNANGIAGINRYYIISPTTNTGLNATISFNYDHSELNGVDENNLSLFLSTNSGTQWTNTAGVLDKTTNKLTLSGVNSFYQWTIGDVNSPLPVGLDKFRYEINDRHVLLKWNTVTEINNYGFEIERKATATPEAGFEKTGFVTGSGNSNIRKEYSFRDKNIPASGKYVYRLKQIDNGGSYKYLPELEVDITSPEELTLNQNFPNPFNPYTNISFTLPEKCRISLSVYNIIGSKILNVLNEEKQAGFHTITIDASKLASGLYVYRLTTDKYSVARKMQIVK